MPTTNTHPKSEFSLRSLHAFIQTINKSCPPELGTDWRKAVQEAFELTAEQKKSLDGIPNERVQEIQTFCATLAHHVQRGSQVHGRISTVPVEDRTGSAAHELHMSLLEPKSSGRSSNPVMMFQIAHCDADCRNWGWG